MKRRVYLGILSAGLLPAASGAQPLCIDFLQCGAMEGPLSNCGRYVDPTEPGPADAYTVQFAVPRGAAAQAWVYYTVDGTAPEGALGVPANEATRVVAAALGCTGLGGYQDVFKASIPASPDNSQVVFVLSARASGASAQEAFLSTGDGACSCSQAGCAQGFEYAIDGGAKPVDDVIMVLQDTPRTLASPGVMRNDRSMSAGVTAELQDAGTIGALSFETDGSLVYTPSPGFLGDDSIDYRLRDGNHTSDWARITFKVRRPPPLVAVAAEPAGEACPGGGQRIESGYDDGAGGGIFLDGILQIGEVTAGSTLCNGVAGGGGGAGMPGKPALVSVSQEPAGDNCVGGGQKIQAGIDANASGVLDEGETTSTSFVCDGARGKSGCSAAPGAVSLLGALGSLTYLGATRRRRPGAPSAAAAQGGNR